MKHLIDISDLSTAEIDSLIEVANDIIDNPVKYQEKCKHTIEISHNTLYNNKSADIKQMLSRLCVRCIDFE